MKNENVTHSTYTVLQFKKLISSILLCYLIRKSIGPVHCLLRHMVAYEVLVTHHQWKHLSYFAFAKKECTNVLYTC